MIKTIELAHECHRLSLPMEQRSNPLFINAMMHFYLVYNKYEEDEVMGSITPLDLGRMLECKSLKDQFVLAIDHFRPQLLGSDSRDFQTKYNLLWGYLYVSRKGITSDELTSLVISHNHSL